MTADEHPADTHDLIRVQGARENNLKDVSVDIPKRRLTVFTGVSGSGKSSLVFDTIAAESRRMIDETYSAFVQGFMPSVPRPDVDILEGLTTAIIVDQERLGANPRSTVGTVTDANAMLRILFSKLGQPFIGGPTAFSFNIPTQKASGVMTGPGGEKKIVKDAIYLGGMCPRCEGRGAVSDLELAQIIDESKSLDEGAIMVPGYTADGWMVKGFSQSGFYPADKPIAEFSDKQRHLFLYGEVTKVKISGINMTYEGLIPKITKSMLSKDLDALQPHIRAFVERVATFAVCPECDGTRLTEGARSSKIEGVSIADACRMQVTDLAEWVRGLDLPEAGPLLQALSANLDAFVTLGLGYLSLERPSGTLSGGEAQRIKMLRHLGSSLTDITYVFDEPTIGLHPHDIQRMNGLLLQLRDKGNTVLVVEHKPETIVIGDHVVDLGPGAGSAGGEICFEGTVEGLKASGTKTGDHLDDRAQLKDAVRAGTGAIEVRGATANNLQDVDVDIPTGVLTVVTGVAGSGKSSLIHGSVSKREGVVAIDQAAIKGSRRSNPATYTGLLEPIRKAFAKANGVKPALFSANSEGACPSCKGAGVIITELGFMDTIETPCEDCGGKRFQASVLEYKLAGKDITQVLDLPVSEARVFFSDGEAKLPAATAILGRMEDVGLGYLSLGQPLSTLSGGERQRIKLAIQMGEKGDVYVLDEPTTGLHLADVDKILVLLDRLVDAGKTVIVIEHHQAVMAHADWIIDIGPGAGHDGGKVVFEGTPTDLVSQKSTLTGEHLAEYVGA
ncbi:MULTISPECIES: excinuclease ABC subunit UvrA [unclassified Microbacterium]|uniref:ATP-binding cassette domain-containing protein n=1 Tax=unclassified Microbacterium TaxID=2609290 RepID=UPI000CFDC42F|nr:MULTISPECIES: excinuclease ABC subunit UvrA [unclassified Microbacterium]PQZ61061.1 daunorubicin resistance protein DrrC [Microbacterium sp. MYb43]PQZ82271.1 daunorubicin resistance protein DrrC [Microbacterium sp. MYb40]PRB24028.1 daunorubicin resistance protein DrrC [Microbacterium sp. MYb54]PRB30859.1 daunorubicin resistance protein DrrC [Microbacterium sp. MYb50]PRB70719.1 daunorubicin resistance protein DrrC [Microbacterium sp. MYb24]